MIINIYIYINKAIQPDIQIRQPFAKNAFGDRLDSAMDRARFNNVLAGQLPRAHLAAADNVPRPAAATRRRRAADTGDLSWEISPEKTFSEKI